MLAFRQDTEQTSKGVRRNREGRREEGGDKNRLQASHKGSHMV